MENLDPVTGGGTIDTVSTFEAPSLQLLSHPGEECCPVVSIQPQEVRGDPQAGTEPEGEALST